jgi:hypothetical protein
MFPFSDSDTCLQVNLLWRILEYSTTELYLFNSRLLPARISIFDQNQEAEIFKFRWCRQSEFKNQLNLTSKILTRMLHITNINFIAYINFWVLKKLVRALAGAHHYDAPNSKHLKPIFLQFNHWPGLCIAKFAKLFILAFLSTNPSFILEIHWYMYRSNNKCTSTLLSQSHWITHLTRLQKLIRGSILVSNVVLALHALLGRDW